MVDGSETVSIGGGEGSEREGCEWSVLHSVVAQVNKLYRQGSQISWQPSCVAPVWIQQREDNAEQQSMYLLRIKLKKNSSADKTGKDAGKEDEGSGDEEDIVFEISSQLECRKTTPLFVQIQHKTTRKFIGLNFVQPAQADTFMTVIEKVTKGNIDSIGDVVHKTHGGAGTATYSGSSSLPSHSRSGSVCSSAPSLNDDSLSCVGSETEGSIISNNFSKKGFLYQKVEGTFSKAWKRFWVELKDNRLIFFKTSTLSHGSSTIGRNSGSPSSSPSPSSPNRRRISTSSADKSSDSTSTNALNMDTGMRHHSTFMIKNCLAFPIPEEASKRDWVFGVSFGDGNVCYLQASSRHEMKSWIKSIHLACARVLTSGSHAELEDVKVELIEDLLRNAMHVLKERNEIIESYSVEDAYFQHLASEDTEGEFDTSKDFKKLKQRTLKKRLSENGSPSSAFDAKSLKGTLKAGEMKILMKEMEALRTLQEKRMENVRMEIFRVDCYLSAFQPWDEDHTFPSPDNFISTLSSATKQCITKSGCALSIPLVYSFIASRESNSDNVTEAIASTASGDDVTVSGQKDSTGRVTKVLPKSLSLEDAISLTKIDNSSIRRIERNSVSNIQSGLEDEHYEAVKKSMLNDEQLQAMVMSSLDSKAALLMDEDIRKRFTLKKPKHQRSKSDASAFKAKGNASQAYLSERQIESLIQVLKNKCATVDALCPKGQKNTEGSVKNADDAPAPVAETKPKTLSRREYRGRVIDEFLNTELNYIADLEYLCSVYLDPLTNDGKMEQKFVNILCSNIRELVAFHRGFAKDLKTCCEYERAGDIDPESNASAETIGDCIVRHIDGFHLYSYFCEKYQKALELLDIISREGKSILDFIQIHKGNSHLFSDREAETKCFESYFIKPVQRILKYPLLIKELLKVTENDAGRAYLSLEKAARAMGEVAEYINEVKREGENEELCANILSNVEGFKTMDRSKLGRLVYHGQIHMVGLEAMKSATIKKQSHKNIYECFLFRKALTFCEYNQKKPSSNSSMAHSGSKINFSELKLHVTIPINALLIRNREDNELLRNSWEIVNMSISNQQGACDDSPSSPRGGKKASTTITSTNPVTYLLYCKSPEHKSKWISVIKENIKQTILEKQQLSGEDTGNSTAESADTASRRGTACDTIPQRAGNLHPHTPPDTPEIRKGSDVVPSSHKVHSEGQSYT
eukprot:Nk52_evm3s394 gene=Nk52_evmTU3s394